MKFLSQKKSKGIWGSNVPDVFMHRDHSETFFFFSLWLGLRTNETRNLVIATTSRLQTKRVWRSGGYCVCVCKSAPPVFLFR